MRIVAGALRGRRLLAPDDPGVRPTSDRVRQSLFDRLAHGHWPGRVGDVLAGAVVLDAFCGTGALAFEALSRGAVGATLMDSADSSVRSARRNAVALGLTGRVRLVRADATRPPAAPHPADIVFLDPPYGADLATPALAALDAAGWIGGALVVLETAAGSAPEAVADYDTLDRRRLGTTELTWLQRR